MREIKTDDYLRLIGVTSWVVRAPQVFSTKETIGDDVYIDNTIYLGNQNSNKAVIFLLAPTERKYTSLAQYFLQAMFKNSSSQVSFITNDRNGDILSNEICKYSKFILLKSKECNIVKENGFEIDMQELSIDISYKRQVMLDVFKLSDYSVRG